MNDNNYNSHTVCKAMQNAALNQIVSELKEFIKCKCVYKSRLILTLNSMEEVISAYNCVPCDCLKKRVKTLKQKVLSISEIEVKIFISEIEAFLNSDSTFEITLKDNSSHQI